MGKDANPADPNSQKQLGRLDMIDSVGKTGGDDFDTENGENQSLINKAGKAVPDSVKTKMGEIGASVQGKIEEKTGDLTKPNYIWMGIFFAVGCLFLLAAFTSLPFILISPAGFNMYFSLFSTCMLISVSFYYGPLNYIKQLFEKKNLMISCLYIFSTLASLMTIFSKAGYLWSIGLVCLQSISIFFFAQQIFMGGDNASESLKGFV